MSKISNSTFKEGYVINKIKHNTVKDKPIDFDDLYYPNGIIPFIFLLFLLFGGLLIVMLVAWKFDTFFSLRWQNYFVSVPGVTLCLNLFWLIARTGIFNSFGYFGMKMSRISKITWLKEKIHVTPINSALNEIKNYDEFNKYVSFRQKNTQKFLYISLFIHGMIFLISVIVLIIVEFI